MNNLAAVKLHLDRGEEATKADFARAELQLNTMLDEQGCTARVRFERHDLGHQLVVAIEWPPSD